MNDDVYFIKHIPCNNCGSSDAGSLYSDDHTFCHKCGHYVRANGTETEAAPPEGTLLIPARFGPMKSRGISEETCRKFRYGYGRDKNGVAVHLAHYTDSCGRVTAQKVRGENKKFSWVGSAKSTVLFGQQLWSGGGRRVVVTEGEIDALSVAEVLPTWPVVSIQNGAQGAKKSLQAQLEWLESFQEIVLCFDNDSPGQDAARECAEVFTPGKCKIAALALKDANEMLMAGRRDELRQAILFNAKVHRPDGIICGNDPGIREFVLNFQAHSDAHYPWPEFDKALFGMRLGELVTHTAGTGIGKSTICKEIAYYLGVVLSQKVGIIALEENKNLLGLSLVSIAANRRLHLNESGLSVEKKDKLFDQSIGNGNFYLYDHWGSTQIDNLLAKIRYLVKGCGCRWIILDHLSIVVSGMEGDDERKNLDLLMTKLRTLAEEEPACGIHVVSHLSRKHDGKSHEEGAPISLRDLRGSHSIVQLSDIVLGYERNQQDEDGGNRIRVRKLKDRYSGKTGVVGELEYNDETGRVVEPGDFGVEEKSAREEPGF